MKFCKDCAHFLLHRAVPDECTATPISSRDPVDGGLEICGVMRMKSQPCGPDAKLFVLRHKPKWWMFRWT